MKLVVDNSKFNFQSEFDIVQNEFAYMDANQLQKMKELITNLVLSGKNSNPKNLARCAIMLAFINIWQAKLSQESE